MRVPSSSLDEANFGIVIPKLFKSGMMKWDDYEYFLFLDVKEKAKIDLHIPAVTHTHPPFTALVVEKAHSSVDALYFMQRLLSFEDSPPHNVGCLSGKRKYSVVCGIMTA